MNFTYDALPNRVIFGPGRWPECRVETARLGKRALVLTTPGRAALGEQALALLGDLGVGSYAGAEQHVPYATIGAALPLVAERRVDVLVAAGGGSTIGLAKGIALETGLPILAIPTTYAGSEMTHIWGISRAGQKTTGRDPAVKPKTVIYDPELLLSLPPAVSITSGLNAMAHAVEALYAADANPISSLMAEAGVKALAEALPLVAQNPADLPARSRTLYGAWLSATVLAQVGMALHHKLCHVLGGSFGLPHAATHTVMLPYVTAFNAGHAPAALAALARALDCDEAAVAGAIQAISRRHGGPLSLKELGLAAADLDEAAALAMQNRYDNPRPFDQADIRDLLARAYEGAQP